MLDEILNGILPAKKNLEAILAAHLGAPAKLAEIDLDVRVDAKTFAALRSYLAAKGMEVASTPMIELRIGALGLIISSKIMDDEDDNQIETH